MKKNEKGIFAIHGGGNIGLGLMADIVSRSHKYRIVATSSNQFTNNIINSSEEFWLQHQNTQGSNTSQINHINMLNSRDTQNIIKLYNNADMGAICLTEEAVKKTAPSIAQGLIVRSKSNHDLLKILVLMNKHNCDKFVKNEVIKAMKLQIEDSTEIETILSKVQFIPTVADRIISKISDNQILDQIKGKLRKSNLRNLTSKDLAELREQFDFKFYLFNAEKKFSLYVPDSLREASYFPGATTVHNLNLFMTVKNKYINGPHAILAWLGGLMNYTTISQAIKDPLLRGFITSMMEEEIAPVLMTEFAELSESDLAYLRHSFIERCEQNSTDTITRVGRDPLRKLNAHGCIRGILELKQKNNLKMATPRLEKGIAAGILYAVTKIDPNNSECQKILDIYRAKNSFSSILCFKGHYDGRLLAMIATTIRALSGHWLTCSLRFLSGT